MREKEGRKERWEATQSGVLARSVAQEPPGDRAGCWMGESSGREEQRIYLSGSFLSLVSHSVKFTPCGSIPLHFWVALSSAFTGCPLGMPDPPAWNVVFHSTLEVTRRDKAWETGC